MNKAFFSIKPWLVLTLTAFTVCALVGGELRYLRLTGDIVGHPALMAVLLEHCLAGLGVTAIFSFVFSILVWSADIKQTMLSSKVWFVSTLFAEILIILSIYLFESDQSETSVYGGLPRGYIQWDQVISGVFGVMLFLLLSVAWSLANRRDVCSQVSLDPSTATK